MRTGTPRNTNSRPPGPKKAAHSSATKSEQTNTTSAGMYGTPHMPGVRPRTLKPGYFALSDIASLANEHVPQPRRKDRHRSDDGHLAACGDELGPVRLVHPRFSALP